MSKTWRNVLIGVGVVLLILLAAIVVLGILGYGGGFYSTQPGYRMPYGPFGRMPMMDGRFGWAGWVMMVGLVCIPPLLLILLVALIVGLATRSRTTPPPPPPAVTPAKTCPNCGRTVQEDWKNCPYCGQTLVS